jgi:Ferritin-like domain
VAADPTRRTMIAATAALPLLAAGCRGAQALGTPPQPAPDVTRLRGAISAEELMVARYQAAIRLLRDGPAAGTGREPAISATLASLLAEHQDHLRQLRSRLIPGSPLAAGSAPLRQPAAPVLPRAVRQALGYLASAERAASDTLLSQVPHVPPSLAQLLASISASEATHVPVLHAAGAA